MGLWTGRGVRRCVAWRSWSSHRCERTRSVGSGFTLGRRPKGSFSGEGLLSQVPFFLIRACVAEAQLHPRGIMGRGGIHQTSNKWFWVRASYSRQILNCGAHRFQWELRKSRCNLRWHFQPSPEMGGHQLYLLILSCQLPIWCKQLWLAARLHLATSRVNLMKWVVFWWPEGKKHINLETIKPVWHVLL